jgi:hypothetical protein
MICEVDGIIQNRVATLNLRFSLERGTLVKQRCNWYQIGGLLRKHFTFSIWYFKLYGNISLFSLTFLWNSSANACIGELLGTLYIDSSVS